uniref:Glutathione peroxidase n=1 Tax=Bicosoecida sp. CB-2014 TaxID=1486930 RepID=A0A7S1CNP0_9STRA|mmetsp:Transcript_5644/g.20224  ORF Transcript_5644/g.20224 Transcript_5644/m.20224 type:complete len:146 (+) Transcript_5644:307-744(+)
MLHTLQQQYASKPVRFFLLPCNQFGAQEPKANSDIKTFASGYVDLTQGNVVLLAKGNVNPPACASTAAGACGPASDVCCPANDGIYNYLRSVIPGAIPWNFDKFIVGKDGVPVPPALTGAQVASDVVPAIDAQLAAGADAATTTA